MVEIPLAPKALAEYAEKVTVQRDRLRETLTWINDPSYIGSYGPEDVVVIYREWAAKALAALKAEDA